MRLSKVVIRLIRKQWRAIIRIGEKRKEEYGILTQAQPECNYKFHY